MSLELIPCDAVDVRMGVAVRLPPVGCYSESWCVAKRTFS
jgi:hypothetical protein